MKQLFAVFTLLVLLVVSSVTVASAAAKIIYPEMLTPYADESDYHISPNYAKSGAATLGCYFYARVKLPVGKTVRRIEYFHYGWIVTDPPYTQVSLQRKKINKVAQYVTSSWSSDNTSSVVMGTIGWTDTTNTKIKSGYKYWVDVYSANYNSLIHGIKIIYN